MTTEQDNDYENYTYYWNCVCHTDMDMFQYVGHDEKDRDEFIGRVHNGFYGEVHHYRINLHHYYYDELIKVDYWVVASPKDF